jgi:ribosomal protein L21
MSASNALGREAAAKLGNYGASAASGEGEAPIDVAASAEAGADARSGSASGSAETEGAGRGLVVSEQPRGGEGREGAGRKRRLRLKDLAEGPRKQLIGKREASRALAFAFPRGVTPDTLFAVVNLGGRQYKVCEGDIIVAERLNSAPIATCLTLPVALLGSRSRTVIGRPTVPGVHVLATVEEHARGSKVIVFKKKRRKRYQRTQGHRRDVTRLRVTAIAGEGIATF